MYSEWTILFPIGPFFAYHTVAWKIVCILHLCSTLCVGILLWDYELGWWQVIASGVWFFFVVLQYTGIMETATERHAFVVHLFSAFSIFNFLTGWPLSHPFVEFALEIRVCRYINLFGNLAAIGVLVFFVGYVMPNYSAWGCYPSRSPSSHTDGMCSTPPEAGTACTYPLPWWASVHADQSLVCISKDPTVNFHMGSCCEPKHTVYQQHGEYAIFGIKAILFSAGSYFVGTLLAWQTEVINLVEGDVLNKKQL